MRRDLSGKNVAVVFDCFFPVSHGGGERLYREISERLEQRGANVSYVTRKFPLANIGNLTFDLVSIWDGEIYNQHGIRKPIAAVRFAFALFCFFLKRRASYDFVIVSATPVLNIFATQIGLFGSQTLVVADWLEVWPLNKWSRYSGPIIGLVAFVLQWFALQIGTIQLTTSKFTLERLRRYRKKSTVIVLGLVDLAAVATKPRTTRNASQRALFVGRHITDKNVTLIPQIVSIVQQTYPSFECHIAGSGPETPRLVAEIERLGLHHSVKILGRVEDNVLAEEFRGASLLLNTSTREGFGLVVAEAAAFGTPSVVVSSPDNAATDLIEPGVNGQISPTLSAVDIAECVVKILASPDGLRASTLQWFQTARVDHGLTKSIDDLTAVVSRSH